MKYFGYSGTIAKKKKTMVLSDDGTTVKGYHHVRSIGVNHGSVLCKSKSGSSEEVNKSLVWLYDVCTLLPVFAGGFACCLGTLLFEVLVMHHLSHDETFLEVRVDSAGSLWRFRPFL